MKAVKLQEPSSEKLQGFIDKLSSITEIVQKKNLKRLGNYPLTYSTAIL